MRAAWSAAAALWLAPAIALALDAGSAAQFSWVSYEGRDPAEHEFPSSQARYRNPVIPGFQPDPSIVRVQDDYYLINSSFAFFPGIPIFHSRDLVSWEQIGNAIDRPEQFNFDGLGVARAIFAPTIRWHDGVFYIVGTCEDCGFNFIISAINPAGPWSDPTWLKSIDGVDPDLFVDADGRAWIANNGPPRQAPLYEGHRAIWLQEFDLAARKMLGPREVVVDGGVDIAQHPIWIEGPHLIRKAAWYYLIAAEGGTAGGHSEVVFRSEKVTGPYIPAPGNPILTQRDLNPQRPFAIAAAGHADFVQTQGGGWWSVFLATRPYEANLSNLGRETFLLPVDWQYDWPRVLPPKTAVPHVLLRPPLPATAIIDRSHWRESFDSTKLSPDWEMLRTPSEKWYSLDKKSGRLILQARAESISGSGNPSFLGKRQRHQNAVVETEVRYVPVRSGDRAGLVVFADERHHYFLGLWRNAQGSKLVLAVRNGANDPAEGRIIAAAPYRGAPGAPVRLRVSARGAAYDFAYAIGRGPWIQLLANADGRMLASELTNLFTGTMIGVYAERSAVSQ
ncbi:MAG: glycoside hydrolase family 43 protein [Steroidobacteraceae bacterium]